MTLLTVKHLTITDTWTDQPLVSDVNFTLTKGETLGVIGESGSGKSTLSRMILGIEKPDKGCVTLNDQPMHKKKVRRHQIGAVFAKPSCSP